MKIILLNNEQYSTLWSKLQLQQRMQAEYMPASIRLPHLDTLLVLSESVTLGSIEPLDPSLINLQWLTETVIQKKYTPIEKP